MKNNYEKEQLCNCIDKKKILVKIKLIKIEQKKRKNKFIQKIYKFN